MSNLGVYCSSSDVAALVQESRNLTRKSTRPGGAQTVHVITFSPRTGGVFPDRMSLAR